MLCDSPPPEFGDLPDKKVWSHRTGPFDRPSSCPWQLGILSWKWILLFTRILLFSQRQREEEEQDGRILCSLRRTWMKKKMLMLLVLLLLAANAFGGGSNNMTPAILHSREELIHNAWRFNGYFLLLTAMFYKQCWSNSRNPVMFLPVKITVFLV